MSIRKDCKMSTPWGTAQVKIEHTRGIFTVHTAGHGGLAISKALGDAILSDKAKKYAIQYGNYYFFEEDCAVSIAIVDSNKVLSLLADHYGVSKAKLYSDSVLSNKQWYPEYDLF